MEAMWRESDCRTPLTCLLSVGSDPTENIERLAKSKVSSLTDFARAGKDILNSSLH